MAACEIAVCKHQKVRAVSPLFKKKKATEQRQLAYANNSDTMHLRQFKQPPLAERCVVNLNNDSCKTQMQNSAIPDVIWQGRADTPR